MKWLLNRLREPSTAAGVFLIADAVAKIAAAPAGMRTITAVQVLAGAAAVVLPEAKAK